MMDNELVRQYAEELFNNIDLSKYQGDKKELAEEFARAISNISASFVYSLKKEPPEPFTWEEWNDFYKLYDYAKEHFDDIEMSEFKRTAAKVCNEHDENDELTIADHILLNLQAMIRANIYYEKNRRN